MAERMTLHNPAMRKLADETLNETLADLGYRAMRDPANQPGVKMILAKGDVEVFRGRADEVWAWLRQCPGCEFRGYTEESCTCGGTGERAYFCGGAA